MVEVTSQVRRTIDTPPAKVWAALTDIAAMKEFFFGADVRTDWKVGHPIIFSGEFKGRPYQDKGEILDVSKDRRLSLSHYSPLTGAPDVPDNYHVVTFDLVPKASGTEIVLTQSNLTGGIKESDLKGRAQFDKNWSTLLQSLDKVVTAGVTAR